jgi:hypothetical protein
MLNELESNYDCANAGADLHALKQELAQLTSDGGHRTEEEQQVINRLENQIHFIHNKCDIH